MMRRRILVALGIAVLALALGFTTVQVALAADIYTDDICDLWGGPPCGWVHLNFQDICGGDPNCPTGCVEVYLPLPDRAIFLQFGPWVAGRCPRGGPSCQAGITVFVPDLGHWEGSGDYPYADGDGNVTIEVADPCESSTHDFTHLLFYVGDGDPNALAAQGEEVPVAATLEDSRGWFVFHVANGAGAEPDQYAAIIQELEAELGVPFDQMWVKGGPDGDRWHNLGDMLNNVKPAE